MSAFQTRSLVMVGAQPERACKQMGDQVQPTASFTLAASPCHTMTFTGGKLGGHRWPGLFCRRLQKYLNPQHRRHLKLSHLFSTRDVVERPEHTPLRARRDRRSTRGKSIGPLPPALIPFPIPSLRFHDRYSLLLRGHSPLLTFGFAGVGWQEHNPFDGPAIAGRHLAA